MASVEPANPTELLQDIQACAARLVQRGWDESTGGNLSTTCPACPNCWKVSIRLDTNPTTNTGTPPILATTSGKHWRALAANPASCLVHYSPQRQRFRAHPNAAGTSPTLELLIHLAVQCQLREKNWDSCAVLHLHLPALLALSMMPDEQALSAFAALPWLFPEGSMLLGEHVPLIPYMPAGSPELAHATAAALAQSPLAVWQNHGVIAAAPRLGQALDILETAELAAEVYLRCLQAGYPPRLITPGDIGLPPGDTKH